MNVFFSDRYENKNRNRFEFGTSERMSLKEAVAKVQEQIAAVNILVTHGGAQYAKLLRLFALLGPFRGRNDKFPNPFKFFN